MAKHDKSGAQTRRAATSAAPGNTAGAADPMEQRLMAFAEQLGRIVGTVQAKTEGWIDREALNTQIAGVRDSASALLEELKAGVSKMTVGADDAARTAAGSRPAAKSKGRSGGVVDAPGKKHRKPTPADPRALAADAKASNVRSSKASMKTMKRRGRG